MDQLRWIEPAVLVGLSKSIGLSRSIKLIKPNELDRLNVPSRPFKSFIVHGSTN